MITIAHRLSTAERADRVAVLDRGRLVEIASHDELLRRGSHYARLWESWQAGVGEGLVALPDGDGDDRARPAEGPPPEDEGGHARRPTEPPPGER